MVARTFFTALSCALLLPGAALAGLSKPPLPGKSATPSASKPPLPGQTGTNVVGAYKANFADPGALFRAMPYSAQQIADWQSSDAAALALMDQGLVPSAAGDGTTTPDTSGLGAAPIQDVDGKYQLVADDDGNIVLADANAQGAGILWVSNQNVINSDDQGRTLLYYPAVMAARGISRLRLADPSQIPQTSQYITLTPLDIGTGTGNYVALDTAQNAYYLVTCTYSDNTAGSRVFIVADPKQGVAALKNPSVQTTVTGGVINDCGYIPWVSPGFAGL